MRGQLLDQPELLEVLLPEACRSRQGELEETGHDLADPAEVSRPACILEGWGASDRRQREGISVNPRRLKAAGVDLFRGGGEHCVRARRLRDCQVGIECAGIPVKVLAWPELGRVTNTVTITGPPMVAARRISAAWPAWRAPMVGTSTPPWNGVHSVPERRICIHQKVVPAELAQRGAER